MATVDGLTKERMLQIEANCVVGGAVLLDGTLRLQKQNGTMFNAGSVRGTRWGATPVDIDVDSTDVPVDFGDGSDPSVGDLVISSNVNSMGEVYAITEVLSVTNANIVDTGINLRGVPGAPGSAASAYPVGSIYVSKLSTDPATLLGFGTWARFGQGKVMVSQDSTQTEFDTAEETGGAKSVDLPAHVHDGAPLGTTNVGHTGTSNTSTSGSGTRVNTIDGSNQGNHNHDVTGDTGNPTSTPPINVLNPYIVVYVWVRTA
jgi:hypothetical protein